MTTQSSSARLDGRVAIITGAASGIGAAAARRLASDGARVLVTDIDTAGGAALCDSIGARNSSFILLDVTQQDQWGRAMQAVIDRYGRLDFLVHCAGLGGSGSVELESLEHWHKVMDTNVTGAFLAAKHAIPLIARAGGGAIVNIASTAGVRPLADFPAYSSAKAAVIQLSKVIALHCARKGYGIRCNAILPGITDTPRLTDPKGFFESREAMLVALAKQSQPMGRVLQPAEIAGCIAYLVSSEAAMVTGIALPVDGGYLL